MDLLNSDSPYARLLRRRERIAIGVEAEERTGEEVRVVALSLRQRAYLARILKDEGCAEAEGLKLILDLDDLIDAGQGQGDCTCVGASLVNTGDSRTLVGSWGRGPPSEAPGREVHGPHRAQKTALDHLHPGEHRA